MEPSSAKLGIDSTTAKTRYDGIRTSFVKCVKDIKGKSGAGRNDVPALRLDLEHLRWLIVHIRHRSSVTNFRSRKLTQPEIDNENEKLDYSQDTSERPKTGAEEQANSLLDDSIS